MLQSVTGDPQIVVLNEQAFALEIRFGVTKLFGHCVSEWKSFHSSEECSVTTEVPFDTHGKVDAVVNLSNRDQTEVAVARWSSFEMINDSWTAFQVIGDRIRVQEVLHRWSYGRRDFTAAPTSGAESAQRFGLSHCETSLNQEPRVVLFCQPFHRKVDLFSRLKPETLTQFRRKLIGLHFV